MDDSKMEDGKENVSDTPNGDSKEYMTAFAGVENEELTNMQETQNMNNNSPESNGEGVEDLVQSSAKKHEEEALEQPGLSILEKEAPLEPSVTAADVKTELHVDLPNQLASEEPSVMETQAKEEPKCELNEMDLDQKASDDPSGTALEAQPGEEQKCELNKMDLDHKGGTIEEGLKGEEAPMELYHESERNGELLLKDEEELTLIGEQGEEKVIPDSNGFLDTRSKDEKFEDVATESGLPKDYGLEMKEELDENEIKEELSADELEGGYVNNSFLLGPGATEDEETGTPEEQVAFVRELAIFHKERFLDFRPPKFYQEPLNLLKLWRAVVRLGGYETVTSCKLWRQIGESFKPPKTCTTVSWTFRCFYEKAILEYEKHKLRCGELPYTDASFPQHVGHPMLAAGPGRQRRDAAARAMQGWHSQRLTGNGEDKTSTSTPKREKPLKSIGLLKRKKPSPVDHSVQPIRMRAPIPHSEADVIDIGNTADWVKINVQRTKDCFEVYALVPGLLREEVRVQSDAVGRLVISGEPEQSDNPWGVTPFRKVVSLPSRIDPHQTSAVVTLHGQLFVRVPFDPLDI